MDARMQTFDVESEEGIPDLLGILAAELSLRRRTPRNEAYVYLDTFDWRVHAAGGSLRHSNESATPVLAWARAEKGELRVPASTRPEFAIDLPGSDLRAQLGRILEPRRLLPVAEVERTRQVLDVLDEERKTVCRLHVLRDRVREPGATSWTPEQQSVRLEGLRGYEEESQAVERMLHLRLGLAPQCVADHVRALAAIGRDPSRSPSDPKIHLDRDMIAVRALLDVCRALLDVMCANEEGLLAEIDTEFLHDFRVAVRRTRSVLGQMRQVLPDTAADHYGGELAWLGKLTGPARDLDVLALALDARVAAGSEEADTLEALDELLRRRRRSEQRHIVAALRGKRYRDLVGNWREFIDAAESADALPDAAHEPAAELVARRIRKRLRAVLELGASIEEQTPGARIHELRIQCKKLRYLLEMFRTLFDEAGIARCIRQLKKLQTDLGDFNDARVHAGMLSDLAHELDAEREQSASQVLAIGRWTAHLADRAAELRSRSMQRFARFACAENRELFASLFGKKSTRRSGGRA
jgi:CHAD domain-containing protein